MENLQCVPRVTTRARQHKEGIGVLSARVWAGQWQKIRDGSYSRQYSLCQGSRQIPIRAILFGYIEKLPRWRKHLEIFLDSNAYPENGQHLLEELPGEADNNISTPGLRYAHGQANNSAPRKVETRVIKKNVLWSAPSETTRKNLSQFSFQ